MLEGKTKVCSICGVEKSLNDYNKNKGKKFGVDSRCKVCKKEQAKAPHRIEYQKQYYKENKRKIIDRSTERNKEKRELVNLQERIRYSKRTQEQKEKRNAYRRQWRKDNPEKVRGIKQRRRAREKETQVENFTNEELLDFWNKNEINYKECFYCEKEMPDKVEHIDHYVPLAKGGTHTKNNLRPSCARCNTMKSILLPETFEEKLNGL